jgi:CBS domain-containing protein
MDDMPVGNIIRIVRTVAPDDIVSRAAESIRTSKLTEVPVLEAGRVLGMVTEASILKAINRVGADTALEMPVRELVTRDDLIFATPYMSTSQVAAMMDAHRLESMAVVDDYGNYIGLLARADVVSAVSGTIRPESVGGLATPLGVYLTTGNHRAGASDFGLFLTGVSLGLMFYLSVFIVFAVGWLVQRLTNVPLLGILNSTSIGTANWMDALKTVMLAAPIPIFLLMMRISPLSGYHAGEHQTVNAIENGEPLKPEYVQRMSRVHPRCGTNLMVGVMLFVMVSDRFSSDVATLLAVFVVIFGWKTIGGFFQYYITTKTAGEKQLLSGIEAGTELLERYRRNPAYRVTGRQRIWNTGMPQVMIGMLAISAIAQMFHGVLPFVF